MRTLIDIPDEDLSLLNQLAKKAGKSRTELVRQAVAAYLASHKRTKHPEGFGLWRSHPMDGVAYQEKLRREWKD